MDKSFEQALRLLVLLALAATSFLKVSVAYAAPGDCDGTPVDDVVICIDDPDDPDDAVGLGLGDDTYVQEGGVTSDYVGGDALEDGTEGTGNGGADHITIDGIVTSCVDGDNVDGNGGNDTIIINGEVHCEVSGDFAVDNGGDDNIIVSGEVDSDVSGDNVGLDGGDDTITVNGEVGDDIYGDYSGGDGGNDTIIVGPNANVAGYVLGDLSASQGGNDTIIIDGNIGLDVFGDASVDAGGDDTITVNGYVGGDVIGDETNADGGNDTININGTVVGGVYADGASAAGGDDTVSIGAGASIGGDIDGQDGFDTLVFNFMRQSQVEGLDPSSGSLSYNGHTYNWLNFERLFGALAERLRMLFAGSGFLAFDAVDGVKVFQGDRLIAFIPYTSLRGLDPGAVPLRYQANQSQGLYVTVTNLGSSAAQPAQESFQVTIFSPSGVQAAQFTFSN